jgi:hypothetical protein
MNPQTATANYNAGTGGKPSVTPGADLGPALSNTPVKTVKSSAGVPVKLGEIGRSGTFIYSGIITNEEYNLTLTRFEGIRVYEVMRRSDSTIAAMLDVVKLPIEATNWHIKPYSEEAADVEAADLCRQELFGRNIVFPSLIQDAELMLDFGYSVLEKVWNDRVNFTNAAGTSRMIVGLDKLAFRKHRSIYKWETTEDTAAGVAGHMPGITQYVPGGQYSIPMDKLVVFTFHKEGDNYEGIPLLRRVYKDWDIKDKLILINAIRHERQGLGVIQVIAPEGANQEDIDRVIENARATRASEEGVFQNEEGYVVEFMDMKSGSSQLTNIIETIEYHDKQILLAVLAQFVMLGQRSSGSGGSRAVSEDQSKLFELGLESVANNIKATIQTAIIKHLCDYNFSNLNGHYPTIEFDKIGDDNLQIIGETISGLLQANGLTMDPDLEQFIRDLLHAPELPDDIRNDYPNRLINSGKMNMPDPTAPASKALANNQAQNTPPAAGGKVTVANPSGGKKNSGHQKGNTSLHATDALELLRQTKNAALELLAHEHANS